MSQTIPTTSSEYDRGRIIERPHGFYWQDKADDREYGPFATLLEAVLDMQRADEQTGEGETLEEAEDEIGIAGWIDPDTGEPAEESRPHIEDV